MKRIKRFIEIWKAFGLFDKDTWKTLFPPFKGWDVGCGYCAMYGDALKRGKCERYLIMGENARCGTTEEVLK